MINLVHLVVAVSLVTTVTSVLFYCAGYKRLARVLLYANIAGNLLLLTLSA